MHECIQKKSTFEPISREGVTKILPDLFISTSENMVFTVDNTVKYMIKEYINSQNIIFRTNRKKYELVRIKKLLFQLLTFEIVTVAYSVELKKVLFQLARTGDDVLDISINSDNAWIDIPLLSNKGINDSDSEVDSNSERDLMVFN